MKDEEIKMTTSKAVAIIEQAINEAENDLDMDRAIALSMAKDALELIEGYKILVDLLIGGTRSEDDPCDDCGKDCCDNCLNSGKIPE